MPALGSDWSVRDGYARFRRRLRDFPLPPADERVRVAASRHEHVAVPWLHVGRE